MSLRIIKAGLFDTIQDTGRFGSQHLGINPGGAMDRFSAQLANAVLGKELNAAVIEFHFPASQILFEKPAIICLTGGNFSPMINNQPIPLAHPVIVSEHSLLQFERLQEGARAYLSVLEGLITEPWLNSYSTHVKASAGGYKGRAFARYDRIDLSTQTNTSELLKGNDYVVLPWTTVEKVDNRNEIEFLIGSEWHWLAKDMQSEFQSHWFQITNEADRMGYRLAGPMITPENKNQLVSAPASFGTVQLLPNGQLIILMADHQTTGGYPRIAHVITAHLPILAQKKPNDVMRFKMTDLSAAEEKIQKQQKYLEEIQIACKFKMQNVLNENMRS